MQAELHRIQAENKSLQTELEAEKEKSRMLKTQLNQKARKNAKLKLRILTLEEEAQTKVNPEAVHTPQASSNTTWR